MSRLKGIRHPLTSTQNLNHFSHFQHFEIPLTAMQGLRCRMGLGVSVYQKPGECCFNFNCALPCSQLFHETKQLAVDQHKVSQLLAWGIISPIAHNSSRQHLRPRIHLHLRNLTITTHSSLGQCLHCRPTLQGAQRHATKGAGTQDVTTNPLQF